MTAATRAPRPAADLLRHLRRAHDHIDRHYDSPLDLDALARVAGVSKSHFAAVSRPRTARRRCAT